MHPETALLDDWITIWRSEAAAAWADREMHEAMQRGIDTWAEQARTILHAMQASHDDAPGPARPPSPPGSPPAAAAPDERDALIDALHARIAELERHLAGPQPPDA